MLTILLGHEEDVEHGMVVSAEVVKTVLATFEPVWLVQPSD
jgi:hypothetical protein